MKRAIDIAICNFIDPFGALVFSASLVPLESVCPIDEVGITEQSRLLNHRVQLRCQRPHHCHLACTQTRFRDCIMANGLIWSGNQQRIGDYKDIGSRSRFLNLFVDLNQTTLQVRNFLRQGVLIRGTIANNALCQLRSKADVSSSNTDGNDGIIQPFTALQLLQLWAGRSLSSFIYIVCSGPGTGNHYG
jgi:hypothetical protein